MALAKPIRAPNWVQKDDQQASCPLFLSFQEPFFPLNPNIQKMSKEDSSPLPGIMETPAHIVEDIILFRISVVPYYKMKQQ